MSQSNSSAQDGEAALPKTIVLDACVLLNLHASGRIEDILASLPSRNLVSPYARREALWHYGPLDPITGNVTRCEVALEPLVVAGLIEVVELTGEEQMTFVDLAQQLGDGEAASGALAIGRSATVATDDRKAQRLFGHRVPAIEVIGTATLLRSWEILAAVNRTQIADALCSIRLGAKFEPHSNEGETAWWHERIRETPPR